MRQLHRLLAKAFTVPILVVYIAWALGVRVCDWLRQMPDYDRCSDELLTTLMEEWTNASSRTPSELLVRLCDDVVRALSERRDAVLEAHPWLARWWLPALALLVLSIGIVVERLWSDPLAITGLVACALGYIACYRNAATFLDALKAAFNAGLLREWEDSTRADEFTASVDDWQTCQLKYISGVLFVFLLIHAYSITWRMDYRAVIDMIIYLNSSVMTITIGAYLIFTLLYHMYLEY
jgi:hypothetical protein